MGLREDGRETESIGAFGQQGAGAEKGQRDASARGRGRRSNSCGNPFSKPAPEPFAGSALQVEPRCHLPAYCLPLCLCLYVCTMTNNSVTLLSALSIVSLCAPVHPCLPALPSAFRADLAVRRSETLTLENRLQTFRNVVPSNAAGVSTYVQEISSGVCAMCQQIPAVSVSCQTLLALE